MTNMFTPPQLERLRVREDKPSDFFCTLDKGCQNRATRWISDAIIGAEVNVRRRFVGDQG